MLLKNEWVKQEIKEEILKIETNENENITVWNLCDEAKASQRGKYISTQAYLKLQEKSQINNLTLYLKEVERDKQTKAKERRKIVKMRAEINDTETNNNKKTSITNQRN